MKEKGTMQILIVFLILAGIAVGVYLVQQRTNILPKAFVPAQSRGEEALNNMTDLENLMKDLDNTNIDTIDDDLLQSDIDAASF